MLWGSLFLNEDITLNMIAACCVILLGTAFANGIVQWPLTKAKAVTL
jgi:drug/metabolite transporter (DMT)-like permease